MGAKKSYFNLKCRYPKAWRVKVHIQKCRIVVRVSGPVVHEQIEMLAWQFLDIQEILHSLLSFALRSQRGVNQSHVLIKGADQIINTKGSSN